jgi:hypothetical protein
MNPSARFSGAHAPRVSSRRASSHRRSGFTWKELLAVIIVLAFLFALLLPAAKAVSDN